MSTPALLFVDDEPMILSSLARLFDDDYQVFTADSGLKALDILSKENIGVVISDQRMPEMLGHQLLAKVKAIKPDAVRILLTGYSDIDDTIRSINDGEIFRYVNKPWKANKLSETIALAHKLHQKLATEKNVQLRAEMLASASAEPPRPRLLLIDANAARLESKRNLFQRQYELFVASTPEDAFLILATEPISCILIESLSGSQLDEPEFLTILKTANPDVVSVLVSEVKDAEMAKRLVNEGSVFRYMVRPFSDDEIKGIVGLAAARSELYHQSPMRNPIRQENNLQGFKATIAELAHPFPELVSKVRNWYETRKTY
jgi:response regulator RpfG family c-di-GMP phosphodiesterase